MDVNRDKNVRARTGERRLHVGGARTDDETRPFAGDVDDEDWKRLGEQAYGAGGEGMYERELRRRYGRPPMPPGRFAGVGPRSWRRPDQRIYEDVCDRLTAEPRVDASDIEVTVVDGEVTLKGSVADRETRRIADDLAWNTRGVHDVHDRLRLDARPAASREK